ncbi:MULTISPECIES: Crp/Fnr family transcriptional regulator [Brevundimonas]|uniref:Crp/Fnr family transcriptional regulator n=1 Tax=Brevundimonas TaxID=41275 RepID=UPI0015BA2BCF|nr:Crp/Fnr family transcriptional regulator [Brevundimonas sp. P7753]NWE50947.1 Crp/Fnr family transcriptional regulator [Brevundimonas sp. P7753]
MTNALIEKLTRRDVVSASEIAALAEVLDPPRKVDAHVDIVLEHAYAEHSILLLEGFTARYSTLSDGRRQITEINVAGDFVDLHSLLMKQMDHGVVTLTPCVIAHAPHSRLRRLTEEHAHLTRLLWLDTIVDAAIHRQWLVAMGRRSGLGHLAHLVCELFTRLSAVGLTEGQTFNLPLTQTVLSDALGLSTVHVNRLIAELRREGLVRWSNPQVEILDWPRLSQIAEFDPTYLRLHSQPV